MGQVYLCEDVAKVEKSQILIIEYLSLRVLIC